MTNTILMMNASSKRLMNHGCTRYNIHLLKNCSTHKHNNNSQKRCIYEAPQPKMNIFDRNVQIKHKNFSAQFNGEYDYIRDEMAESMLDRLSIVARKFPNVAELGSGRGHLLHKLLQNQMKQEEEEKQSMVGNDEPGRGRRRELDEDTLFLMSLQNLGIERYHLCDDSEKLLNLTPSSILSSSDYKLQIEKKLLSIQEQESIEGNLPFPEKSMDLILSGLYMHWINNLPSFLSRARAMLKPDGVFMGTMLGGDTLQELRTCFVLAEQEREGGVSPHVSPLVTVRDAGNLLTRAGFTIPTADSEFVIVYYPDAFTLMNHLQYMGENNSLLSRRMNISRETIYGAAAIYDTLFRTEKGIPATFEIVHMIGWAPDPSQPKPARRGSGQIHMKDLAKQFGTELHVAKDEE